VIRYLDKSLSFFVICCLAAIVLCIIWQIISRFIMADPSSWSEELARFLLIWTGVLGAAWTYRQGGHLGLSFFVGKASPAQQDKLYRLAHLCCLIFAAAVICPGGYKLVSLSLELGQTSPVMHLPIGYVYSVIPISGVLIALYASWFIYCGRPVDAPGGD